MPNQPNHHPLLTVYEAAELLRVHAETVRAMLRRDELDAFKTSSDGHWRIRRGDDGMPARRRVS